MEIIGKQILSYTGAMTMFILFHYVQMMCIMKDGVFRKGYRKGIMVGFCISVSALIFLCTPFMPGGEVIFLWGIIDSAWKNFDLTLILVLILLVIGVQHHLWKLGQHRTTLYHNLCGLFSRQKCQKYSTISPISPPLFNNSDKKIYAQTLQLEVCGNALEKKEDLEGKDLGVFCGILAFLGMVIFGGMIFRLVSLLLESLKNMSFYDENHFSATIISPIILLFSFAGSIVWIQYKMKYKERKSLYILRTTPMAFLSLTLLMVHCLPALSTVFLGYLLTYNVGFFSVVKPYDGFSPYGSENVIFANLMILLFAILVIGAWFKTKDREEEHLRILRKALMILLFLPLGLYIPIFHPVIDRIESMSAMILFSTQLLLAPFIVDGWLVLLGIIALGSLWGTRHKNSMIGPKPLYLLGVREEHFQYARIQMQIWIGLLWGMSGLVWLIFR